MAGTGDVDGRRLAHITREIEALGERLRSRNRRSARRALAAIRSSPNFSPSRRASVRSVYSRTPDPPGVRVDDST
jgi:hypothetical protein